MNVLSEPASLAIPSDPPEYQKLLIPAIGQLLERCQFHGRSFTTHVLRIIRSFNLRALHAKPLRFVDCETLPKYSVIWKRLILYLLCTESVHEAHLLHLTDKLRASIVHLRQSLNTLLNTMDTADAIEVLIPLVLDLSVCLIQQPVRGNVWKSVLIHFVRISGYHRETQTWASAFDFSPRLSQMIYIIRIVSLFDALPPGIVKLIKHHSDVISDYHSRYLEDSAPTAFTELCSLRAFAKVACRYYYVHPTILWSSHMESLRYKGSLIELSRLRSWLHAYLTSAEHLFCEELVFRKPSYLASCDPPLFHDKMTWSANRESFVHLAENKLGDGHI